MSEEAGAKAEPRERRLKAGKRLRWSLLSESPSSCAAKGNIVIKRNYSCGRLWSTCVAVHRRGRRDSDGTEEDERLAKCVTADCEFAKQTR